MKERYKKRLKIKSKFKDNVLIFRYLKANDLVNELEVTKDKKIEAHQIEREQLIQDSINKIKKIQKEEKKDFYEKLEKIKQTYYAHQNKKSSKAEKELEERIKEFEKAHSIETQSFNRIINEIKPQGIILSPQMQEQTKKYINYVKQQRNETNSDDILQLNSS